MSKRKTIAILTVATAVFMAFGVFLAYNVSEYLTWRNDGRATVENNNMVRDIFSAPLANMSLALTEAAAAAGPAAGPDLSQFAGLIDALYQVRDLTGNHHIIAYMYIPGTNVNNLVMHAHNNDFYLRRDMFGHHNSNGSLFVDYRNSPGFTDPNTIVYGHNMNNGNMFHDLRHYAFGSGRYEFFRNHPQIKVVTSYEVLVYEIFSVFTTHISFNYIQVHFEDGEFAELVHELNRRRLYDTGITATADDNVLILSTCTAQDRNTRIVVASRLVKRIEI